MKIGRRKLITLFAIGIVCGNLQSALAQTAQASQVQKLDALLSIIHNQYVDSVDQKKITEDAIRSLLNELDPHSVYIPAEDLKQTNESLEGKFEGIGVQFNILDDTIVITQTIAGGPSEKLGLRAGDRIVRIDDQTVAGTGIKNSDVLKKLRGDKGSKVKVEVRRRGNSENIPYTITRDKIPIFSVDASYMAEPGVGYIKINRFADKTVEEFKEALKPLKEQGLNTLILDLTGNGGGYLNRAIELADEFLPAGKKVVYTEGKNQTRQESFATNTGGWEKGRLVILVDETSASASEIVTGAVQDWDRGLVVGRRTFAKGLVQKPYYLPDGSAVRLTIARYYTPSGRCIQKPYAPGDEDYDMDLSERFKHGELYSADSIRFDDSLRYYTQAKRVVYGGGGIMPDVFVPLDTSFNSKYYDELRRNGVVIDYALSYVDENRKMLSETYPDVQAFKKAFEVDEKMMSALVAYAEKKGVKKDEEGLKTSGKLIRTQLEALIARDLWNTSAYYYVVNDINNFYQKALESLDDNTFSKLKIATN